MTNNEIAIAWTDLSVSVKSFWGTNDGKRILSAISGKFMSNSMNALMGSSGSGKSTLLQTLNASNKYCLTQSSKIYRNTNVHKMEKCFIYQNQSERVMTGLTVEQAFTYSSKLKNSGESGVKVSHKKNVLDLMRELLIEDIRDNMIESCSSGQIKRICIGLELTSVRKPNLLFIDEPTTGLDTHSAQVVCILTLYQNIFIYNYNNYNFILR